MGSSKDFFDDIIACMKREASRDGSLFIRRKDFVEFNSPIPVPASETGSPSVQTRPVRPASVPVSPPVRAVPNPGELDHEQLRAAVCACHACPLGETRTHAVFCDGTTQTDLMFIGEGPGADEDAQGIPFVGAAGQLLTKMILAMRYTRENVYIANIVKCRPPGNRNPEDTEAALCLPFLKRQIEIVSPKVIVLLGAVPLRYLMDLKGIMSRRGKWLKYGNIDVMPTYHPAYLLRNPAAKRDVWQDLQLVMKRLDQYRQ